MLENNEFVLNQLSLKLSHQGEHTFLVELKIADHKLSDSIVIITNTHPTVVDSS